MLTVLKPGPVSWFLPELPKLPLPGLVKAAGLYHSAMPLFVGRAGAPEKLGYWEPAFW